MSQHRRSRFLRALLTLTTFTALAVVTAGGTAAAGTPAQAQNQRTVTVMNYNLYLGCNLTPILTAPTVEQAVAESAKCYAHVGQVNFAERAAAIARQVETFRPHVIGLQEVALWEAGPIGGQLEPTYDYLPMFLAALQARGLSYKAVVSNTNFSGTNPISATTQVRFTDHDVILVRADLPPGQLKVSNPQPHRFTAVLPLLSPTGQLIIVPRGWSSVDIKMRGREFRFANTHLEAFNAQVRQAQAVELYATLALSPIPVVLVGDLNSEPDDSTGAYGLAKLAGYHDAWEDVHGIEGGFTAGQPDDLNNEVSTIDHRIDYILFTPRGITAVAAEVIGEEPGDKTASGLWPSDHAGVVAVLALS